MTTLAPLTPLVDAAEATAVLTRTQLWVERAVIGLNLCPFAKAVHAKRQIRYSVTGATTGEELLAELAQELTLLDQADPESLSTTLLVHPAVMTDFLEYNAFLETADDAVQALGLEGVLQVASFHPQYQFADSGPDDIDNYSNRSPFPTLHLLREESIDRAVDAFPSAEAIFGANIRTLRQLGKSGWRALFEDPGDN
ncbi:MAG TPA: DUF1415 domain-containing protein [Steroidobacteraceae bacterium]|nr:DUF1415 domain-containing protein [Steroidobacteraceae bacterium]